MNTDETLVRPPGLDRSQCRFGLHQRLSLLIRVNLRFHFLGPERYTRARLAKKRQAETWRRDAVGHVRSLCSHASAGQDGAMRFSAACGDLYG